MALRTLLTGLDFPLPEPLPMPREPVRESSLSATWFKIFINRPMH